MCKGSTYQKMSFALIHRENLSLALAMMICINIILIITIVIKPNECYSHHDGNSVVMGGYTGGVTPSSPMLPRLFTMWVPHCCLQSVPWDIVCMYPVPCGLLSAGYSLYAVHNVIWVLSYILRPKHPSALLHVYVSITSHSKDLNIVEYMMIHCHLMDMKQHISLAVCLINCYGAGRVRAVAVECTEMRALGICVWVVDRHIQALYMRVFEHAGITHTKLQMGTALHV